MIGNADAVYPFLLGYDSPSASEIAQAMIELYESAFYYEGVKKVFVLSIPTFPYDCSFGISIFFLSKNFAFFV